MHAVGGEVGNDGADGIGGHGGGRGGPKLWLNDADLSSALGNAGAGGAPPCMQYDNEAFCVSGGGGGGWGGGASGSSPHGQYRRAGGGGGDSFAMSSATADTNAPITPPTAPSNGQATIEIADLGLQAS